MQVRFPLEFSPKFKDEGGILKTHLDFPGVRPNKLKVRCDGKSVLVSHPEGQSLVKLPSGVEPEEASAEYVFGRLFLDVVPHKVKPFFIEVKVATE